MGNDPAAGSSGELTWAVERLIGHDLDGRYRVLDLLGKGGMGAVLRARHLFMDEDVAIKVLRPTLARDPAAARRFVREARGTLAVDSDHAVKVLDFAITGDGTMYMVLELLEGRTVGEEVSADGPLPVRRALHVAHQVCDALGAAHRVGLVHRDLKPDNIMLVRRGADPDYVKVLDFGLAKVMEHAGQRALSVAAITQGDLVFGTPDYMAPEQAMGQPLDARADLYALGATLFEMLTGRPPFVADSPMQILVDHVRTPPPTVREVRPELRIGDDVEALLARCLAKRPEARPATAAALAVELGMIASRLAEREGRRAVAHDQTVDLPAGPVRSAVADAARRAASDADRHAPTVPAAVVPPPAAFAPPVVEPGPAPAPARVDRGDAAGLALDDEPEPSRPRSLAPLIIAIALAAAALVVILAVTRSRSGERSDVLDAGHVAAAAGDASAGTSASASTDASIGASIDASMDAGVEVDAGAGEGAADAPARPTRPDPADTELARHLDAAEVARRRGDRLGQIAHADQALALDRRNLRARYLLGDALVATGDRTHGCEYLRAAARLRAARARAAEAGCGAD